MEDTRLTQTRGVLSKQLCIRGYTIKFSTPKNPLLIQYSYLESTYPIHGSVFSGLPQVNGENGTLFRHPSTEDILSLVPERFVV